MVCTTESTSVVEMSAMTLRSSLDPVLEERPGAWGLMRAHSSRCLHALGAADDSVASSTRICARVPQTPGPPSESYL